MAAELAMLSPHWKPGRIITGVAKARLGVRGDAREGLQSHCGHLTSVPLAPIGL
jgi:hypothetical protein